MNDLMKTALKHHDFAGKPKTGYDPFVQAGGYRCRHCWSWLSNATALRLDKTLTLDGNTLRRKS